MSQLRRLILLRHGETVDGSGERLIGSGDPALSDAGRAQVRRAAAGLRNEVIDLVVASPKRRAWQSAALLAGGAPIRLEPDFAEIHFGRWEGLRVAEIEASDPVAFQDWRSGAQGFEYPGGDTRADFQARVRRGLERLLATPARSALLALHKGVLRLLVADLTGTELERERPALGEILFLTRKPEGGWFLGRRSSDPPGLGEAA